MAFCWKGTLKPEHSPFGDYSTVTESWYIGVQTGKHFVKTDFFTSSQFGWSKKILWMFSKIGVPPKSSIFNRVFHYKPSILGYPYSWKHPKNSPSRKPVTSSDIMSFTGILIFLASQKNLLRTGLWTPTVRPGPPMSPQVSHQVVETWREPDIRGYNLISCQYDMK